MHFLCVLCVFAVKSPLPPSQKGEYSFPPFVKGVRGIFPVHPVQWFLPPLVLRQAQQKPLNNLGRAWDSKGKYDKTIWYFEKALAIFKKKKLTHYVVITERILAEALKKKAADKP